MHVHSLLTVYTHKDKRKIRTKWRIVNGIVGKQFLAILWISILSLVPIIVCCDIKKSINQTIIEKPPLTPIHTFHSSFGNEILLQFYTFFHFLLFHTLVVLCICNKFSYLHRKYFFSLTHDKSILAFLAQFPKENGTFILGGLFSTFPGRVISLVWIRCFKKGL